VGDGRKVVYDSDRDPDEVFWWIENNLHLEFQKDSLPEVMELLAKADLYRGLVMKQQNWGFKGYMVDLMVGVSVYSKGGYGYVPYKAPDRFIQLARSRQRRQQLNQVAEKLGKELHCSKKAFVRDFLPYLRLMLEKQDLGLEAEDIETIKG